MLKLIGCILVIAAAAIWGHGRAEALQKRCLLTSSLAGFAEFCCERISIFRDPLDTIYRSFSDELLESEGFLKTLRASGAGQATDLISDKLLEDDKALMYEFAAKIGRSYGDGQEMLCKYTAGKLRESEKIQKEQLSGKIRIYTVMPVLAAISAIILIL